jgi:hypothetical protein
MDPFSLLLVMHFALVIRNYSMPREEVGARHYVVDSGTPCSCWWEEDVIVEEAVHQRNADPKTGIAVEGKIYYFGGREIRL